MGQISRTRVGVNRRARRRRYWRGFTTGTLRGLAIAIVSGFIVTVLGVLVVLYTVSARTPWG